ncbi:MAG: DUF3794 domain-containing protein [Flavonifractor plautii]
MLYRSSAGGLCTAEYELPFSQIMEITGAGESPPVMCTWF